MSAQLRWALAAEYRRAAIASGREWRRAEALRWQRRAVRASQRAWRARNAA